MKIILANNTELEVYLVTGGPRTVYGKRRDALTFIFPESTDINEVDALFTEDACESITIADDEGNTAIHPYYTVRAELKKEPVVISEGSPTSPEVVENRVFITMAQRTYEESQMKIMAADIANAQAANLALQEEVTNTQLALCEVYEMMA